MLINYSSKATVFCFSICTKPNRNASKLIVLVSDFTKSTPVLSACCKQKASSRCYHTNHRLPLINFIYQPIFIQRRWRSLKRLTWPIDHLPFTWTRKEHKADAFKSGDLDHTIGPVNLSMPKASFQLSEELKTASDDVKKLFTLEFASKSEIVEVKMNDLIKKVQRHSVDFDSPEVRIAVLTLRVRRLQEHVKSGPYDKPARASLLKIIEKRNKYLRQMHHIDYERFAWLVKVLEINFEVPDLGVKSIQYTRKNELRRLTKEYTDKIRNDKLEKYHETLKLQQDSFLKEKEEAYKWIAQEEKDLGKTSDS